MRLHLVMAAALLAGAGGCTERRAAPPEPITIAAATIPNFSLVHLAQANGYFKEEGLALTHPELAARMVFMSGGAFTQRARAFFESVPNLRLEKPFDVANLRELVRVLVAAQPHR